MRKCGGFGSFAGGIAAGAVLGAAVGAVMAMNMDNGTKRKIRRSTKAVKSFADDLYGTMSKFMA